MAATAYTEGQLKFPVGPGRAVWNEMRKSATLLNLGVGGDCTQNVLWRLAHGEMDGYHARFVFLMIGTNNVDDSPEDRAEGIQAVIAKIAEKQPSATILLSPIFPCEAKPDSPGRISREKTNSIIRGFAERSRLKSCPTIFTRLRRAIASGATR